MGVRPTKLPWLVFAAGVTGGLDLRITSMDLPLRKGVSSSAAVCILVAKAFDAGIPVVVLDRALIGEKYSCFIAADWKQIGADAGKWLSGNRMPRANTGTFGSRLLSAAA